eukprot:2962351-Pleurochrysis_carterae.AAC.3
MLDDAPATIRSTTRFSPIHLCVTNSKLSALNCTSSRAHARLTLMWQSPGPASAVSSMPMSAVANVHPTEPRRSEQQLGTTGTHCGKDTTLHTACS